MKLSPDELLATARRIADEVLFRDALEVDAKGEIPTAQLQTLADEGFYGVSTYCDGPTIAELIEVLATGCLTTAFVFTQHIGATRAAWVADGVVHDRWAEALASGRSRGGVAFAQILRAGPPMTTTTRSDSGWIINGSAPWVTGWGHIDAVHIAARHDDKIVWALIDAVDSDTLISERLDLAAVDASQTVVLQYRDHVISDDEVTRVVDYESWRADYQLGLRTNGSFALGVASRCCRLLGDDALTHELSAVRDRLNAVDHADMPAARAAASLFAVRAATALVAATGGSAVIRSHHAQRLFREAMFLLVQGQTPTIKSAMAVDLGQSGLRP